MFSFNKLYNIRPLMSEKAKKVNREALIQKIKEKRAHIKAEQAAAAKKGSNLRVYRVRELDIKK